MADESLEHQKLELRAHQLWQERGCPGGSPDIDWRRAEDELRVGRLSTFFKGSGSKLGVFYPTGYLVAVFPDFDSADHALTRLRDRFAADSAIAVSGIDVIHTAGDLKEKEGLWGLIMRELSRFSGTEEVYTDDDLNRAAEGAGFVLVHCPTEMSKVAAWEVIEPLLPIAARHYASGGIDHLKGEA